jgi:hypothetical protein
MMNHYLSAELKILSHNQSFDEIKHWKRFLYHFNIISSRKKSASIYIHQNPFFYAEIFPNHEQIWPHYFEPYKLIFVYRDPIDQFADIVAHGAHIHTKDTRMRKGTENLHPAERFYEINKKFYLARLRMAKEYSPDQLLICSFEQFLKNHQQTAEKLVSFLGIKSKRDIHNKQFILEKSIKNIGKGKNNTEAMCYLTDKPYIMEELYDLHEKLNALPHTIY